MVPFPTEAAVQQAHPGVSARGKEAGRGLLETTPPSAVSLGAALEDALVYLIDDDLGVLQSLQALLETERIRVETYRSAAEFLDLYEDRGPACLILDLGLTTINGLELQHRLTSRGDAIPIIFLTGCGDVSTCAQAMKAGAFDFLQKPVEDTVLFDRVRRAIEEDRVRRREQAERHEIAARLDRLTAREKEVLHLLFAGKTPKRIANQLGIGIQTASKHRARVLEKMEVDGEAELVRLLMRSPRGAG